MYNIEVKVKQLSKDELLSKYWTPDPTGEGCRGCPYYGNAWSCPPEFPSPEKYLEKYAGCFLIAVKVCYPEYEREKIKSAAEADLFREDGYEKVAKEVLITLLDIERLFPGGLCMGAGRCILCSRCARADGLPCRHPELMRYSLTGFGFRFADMLGEQLGVKLLWNPNGLPEYDVVTAAMWYT